MKTIGLIAFAALIATTPAVAADAPGVSTETEEPLPSVHALGCPKGCTAFTRAEIVKHVKPRPPREGIISQGGYVDARVTVAFMIGVDGAVRDPRIIVLVGPQEFADSILAAVQQWTYKPATSAGKAVEQYTTAHFMFVVAGVQPGARPDIVLQYDEALALVKAGKLDDALKIVESALGEPKINLYERTRLALVAASVYNMKHDSRAMERWLTLAMLDGGAHLERSARNAALQLAVVHCARTGQYAMALDYIDQLSPLPSDSPLIKLSQDIGKAIAGDKPIFVSGWIPPADDAFRYWSHLLARRDFVFSDIEGSLTRFHLVCDQQTIESAITETAEWHVPKTWSHCRVFVEGAPGTAFKLMELNDAK